MYKCSNLCLWCSCWWNLDFSFKSYGKESLYKYCMNVDDGRIMHSWRSCLLMVEITTPKPYIFMIRVNRQIKCPKSWGPGSSPSPTRRFFENYTFLWNHFVNFNHTLPKFSLGDPFPKLCSICLDWTSIIHAWVYSLVSYLFIKQDQMILTCSSAVASLMLSQFFNIISWMII